jgi:glycosyltransferase involved in cell wall biosynthesis
MGMRVLILNTQVPFTSGGAEAHADSLQEALLEAGHAVDMINIPFKWYPPDRIHEHLLACRLLDIQEVNGHQVDKVIGLRFPAYHMKHPNKSIWILHQFRTAFEMWGSSDCDLSPHPQGKVIRDSIAQIEKSLLPEAHKLFANSLTVATRLREHCGLEAEPLYHPPFGFDKFHCREYGDYIYCPSRLNTWKRQELAIRALALTNAKVKIMFSGNPDHPSYLEHLQKLAVQLNVSDRVTFLGKISFDEMVIRYASARAVLFIPQEEDYGYVTLEAMLSSKPVLTCTDSGGPLEFIRDGEEGLVCVPTPEAIAEALDKLWANKPFCKEAGEKGHFRYTSMGIHWHKVVSALMA